MNQKWVAAEKVSDDIITQLLYNRGLRDKNAVANFFNPPSPEVIVAQYPTYLKKINPNEVSKSLALVDAAIKANRPIVIHGDYDVDGICGTVILYETLKNLGANVVFFIPDRFDEGYGLSIESIDKTRKRKDPPLLITTDCGITAVNEINYAKSQGLDVVITDHHAPREEPPEADAIVWTDELSGTGIAWFLSSIIQLPTSNFQHLDLVALATIADIQPLTGVNRSLVRYGLEELNSNSRTGLKELIKVSGLEGRKIGTYEVSWMLAPRLNASGRLQNAMESLKLLLTNDPVEARDLAAKLNRVNQERQQITRQTIEEARSQVTRVDKVLILQKETWHEGVIGLVAGKIREEFYRPAVVISKGERISKGSARSVSGFNIIEALRRSQKFLIDAGGHAMAAGFTIETTQIAQFQEHLTSVATGQLTEADLTPTLEIDAEVRLEELGWGLMTNLKKFEPFGVGNPRPVFLTRNVQVLNVKSVGTNNQHLKLFVKSTNYELRTTNYPVIGFGLGNWSQKLRPGNVVDVVYQLEENTWNGQKTLQLKLKDLQKTDPLTS